MYLSFPNPLKTQWPQKKINVVDNYRATYYQQKSRMSQSMYLYGFRGIAGIIPKPKQNYTCTNAISAH